MDALPSPSDDMKELECRLSEWRPSTAGLDADGVLFAAGRASVRPAWGRLAWPIVSGCLALLAATFGVGLSQERAARLELTARLRDQKPPVVSAPSFVPEPVDAPSTEPPAADSYLAAHRALAGNPDSWMMAAKTEPSEGPPLPNRPIWKAGSHPDMLEP
jgi:hypothetical protein